MLLTFAILALTIGLFIWGRLRADLVALLSLLALYLVGIIDAEQALAGFSNPTVVMIAALFVVGEGLAQASGEVGQPRALEGGGEAKPSRGSCRGGGLHEEGGRVQHQNC